MKNNPGFAAGVVLMLTWLTPMLTDCHIYPPRLLDVPLPLTAAGGETDSDLSGLKFHALIVPANVTKGQLAFWATAQASNHRMLAIACPGRK